ncbi:hypothetical protein F4778DRAFT_722479 [Xylariomycetidae sp. FL2044]|nr:hypothetical protein F4778DRAFT_722479 [Xylariomycetidae sp. FL2044]
MGDGPVVPDPRDVVPAPPPRQGGGGGGGGGGGFANVHVHLGPAATTTPSSSSSSLLSPPSRSSNVQQQDRLRAECFCGSVSFAIPRPTAKVLADPILKQCVPPGTDGRRWKAYLDASRDSCRLGGTGVMPWVLVPRMALEPHIGPELRLGSGPSGSSSSPSSSSAAAAAASSSSWGAATLRTYKPSPQVTRAFCAKCGAAVFNKVNTSSTDEDTMVLGVAAGILCAPGGAVKALDWVQWRREVRGVTQSPGQGRGQGQGQGQGGRPSAASRNSNDPEFIASLSAGYKAWLNAEYGGL